MKRILSGAALAAALVAAPAYGAEAPKLVVAIAVDQLGADLFEQWRGRFSGGLRRLSDGVAYTSGFQTHAATETCPGHSTLLTGKRPNKTGIVGNNVRDPRTGESVYCLLDRSVRLTLTENAKPPVPKVSPANMSASTLGEWMKAADPRSRVVAISSKDRGAIVMAGHNPDGVFWMADGKGFTTYVAKGEKKKAKAAPVSAVNAEIARVWKEAPVWNYTHDECRALSATWKLSAGPRPPAPGGATPPRPRPPARGGAPALPPSEFKSQLPPVNWGVDRKNISSDVMSSPIADDLTLAGARSLIKYYNLGRGPATDLLAVSFSATDYVGHRYGSQGPEMCEQLYRVDATIGTLLADIDALGVPYLVVLSADHGGSDFAERQAANGKDAKRINGRAIMARVNAKLRADLALRADPLDPRSAEEVNVVPRFAARKAEIVPAAIKLLAAEPDVAGAFSQDELLATPMPRGKPADQWSLKERLAASTYKGRSADISVALKPGRVTGAPVVGRYLAGHGSPWDYDRRVPILFWWKGAPSETRAAPIETVDIAPTLAAALGLTPPADLDGRCLPLADFGKGGCPAP